MHRGDAHLGLLLALALAACGSNNAPRYERPRPSKDEAKSASTKPSPTAAATRWLWIEGSGGTHLAFYYVDKTAGPSAKGAAVGNPPTPKELSTATDSPSNTFRDPVTMGARALTQAEVDALHLPARPPWLDIFEPAGTTPPQPLMLTEHGRKPTAISKTTGATLENVYIQHACGKQAGGRMLLSPGASLEIGADPVDKAEFGKRIRVDVPGVQPRHAIVKYGDTGITVEPVGTAEIRVNDEPIRAATPMAKDDRFFIASETFILRGADFQGTVGADPSCPGAEHLMHLQDGCARFGKSFIVLIGGDEQIIGTDKPERGKLPPEHDIQPPIHVRIRNEAKTFHFEALDPKRLPLVDGKPLAKGTLALGDTITIGNRVFAIAGPKQEQAIASPAPGCAELSLKKP